VDSIYLRVGDAFNEWLDNCVDCFFMCSMERVRDYDGIDCNWNACVRDDSLYVKLDKNVINDYLDSTRVGDNRGRTMGQVDYGTENE